MPRITMSPERFRAIQKKAKLTDGALAELTGNGSDRTIRKYRNAEREISGPMVICMDFIDILGAEAYKELFNRRS
jgi:hypothetical protein